jgi:hypothetical protein
MTIARFKAAGLCAGIALALTASFPVVSQTDLAVQNDGTALTANAVSSQQVLSMTLRISGPNDFLFEQRVEDSLIQWVPDAGLADGVYHWETIAVTVEKGAPMRPIARPTVSALGLNGSPAGPDVRAPRDDGAKASIAAPDANVAAPEIPVERLFSGEYKSVERETGAFLVRDGWIEPLPRSGAGTTGDDGKSLGATDQQGLFGRVAGAISEFLFPSAHATTNVDNVLQIQDTAGDGSTRAFWESDTGDNWWLQNDLGTMKLVAFPGSNEVFGFQRSGAQGEIGIGTANPLQPLHISDSFPRIRLDDSDDASTWHIKAVYDGKFQIGESSGETSPFTINPDVGDHSLVLSSPQTFCESCVGIGTDQPTRALHIVDPFPSIFLQDSTNGNRWQVYNDDGLFAINNFTAGSIPFRMEGGAPTDSFRIDSAGFVGMGTSNPSQPLHVRRSTDAQVLVENTSTTTAERVPFRLINKGKTRFVINNTAAGVAWTFDNAGGSFQISRGGSGVAEFVLFNNGNAEFEGNVTANGVTLTSSRSLKTDFRDVEESDILDKVSELDIMQWRYKKEEEGTSHIGPMAEEFKHVFGLGDGKTLNMIDTTGITLAAIQGLRSKVEDRDRKITELEARLEDLSQQLERIQADVR